MTFVLFLNSFRYLIDQKYYNHRSKSSLSTKIISDSDSMSFQFSTETQSNQIQKQSTSSKHQRKFEFNSEKTQKTMKKITVRHDHSRKTALLFFANETHDSFTNIHFSELNSKVILNQISNSIFSKQTFLLFNSIFENKIQKLFSILKRSMRQRTRNRKIYNLNRSRLHFFVALKVEKSNYDKKNCWNYEKTKLKCERKMY